MSPTPIVSVQDGPRMSGKISNFGGHKAAPFKKGGKRRAKVLVAKAAVKRAQTKNLSNVDLSFNPLEKRDPFGKWVKGGDLKKALVTSEPGSEFTMHGAKFTKNVDNKWEADPSSNNFAVAGKGVVLSTDEMTRLTKKGFLKTMDDKRIEHSQLMNQRDHDALVKKATTRAKKRAANQLLTNLKNGSPVIGFYR